MEKLKILVADSSVVYRKLISEAVEATGMGNVERTASNGSIALEWLSQEQFDVVLLEDSMPGMSGIETLSTVKRLYPYTEVIMISSSDLGSAAVTIKALNLGALDFILKNEQLDPKREVQLIKSQLQMLFAQIKIKKFSLVDENIIKAQEKKSVVEEFRSEANKIKKIAWSGADVVLIASSTGGPAALETILGGLPADFDKPILVVQHMPPQFTRILAETLDRKCALGVSEGKDGDNVVEGRVIIAPGGLHMAVSSQNSSGKVIKLDNSPFVNGVRPSADVLFNSAAEAYSGRNVLSVILTGMGNDGVQGVRELKKKCNCYCMTQSEASCVVYGMPRCIYEAGLADEVVDIKEISRRMYNTSGHQELIMQ